MKRYRLLIKCAEFKLNDCQDNCQWFCLCQKYGTKTLSPDSAFPIVYNLCVRSSLRNDACTCALPAKYIQNPTITANKESSHEELHNNNHKWQQYTVSVSKGALEKGTRTSRTHSQNHTGISVYKLNSIFPIINVSFIIRSCVRMWIAHRIRSHPYCSKKKN